MVQKDNRKRQNASFEDREEKVRIQEREEVRRKNKTSILDLKNIYMKWMAHGEIDKIQKVRKSAMQISYD